MATDTKSEVSYPAAGDQKKDQVEREETEGKNRDTQTQALALADQIEQLLRHVVQEPAPERDESHKEPTSRTTKWLTPRRWRQQHKTQQMHEYGDGNDFWRGEDDKDQQRKSAEKEQRQRERQSSPQERLARLYRVESRSKSAEKEQRQERSARLYRAESRCWGEAQASASTPLSGSGDTGNGHRNSSSNADKREPDNGISCGRTESPGDGDASADGSDTAEELPDLTVFLRRLWHIFTWYTVYHFPGNAEHMTVGAALHFFSDCGLVRVDGLPWQDALRPAPAPRRRPRKSPSASRNDGGASIVAGSCGALTKTGAELLLRRFSGETAGTRQHRGLAATRDSRRAGIIGSNAGGIRFGEFCKVLSCLAARCHSGGGEICGRCSALAASSAEGVGELLLEAALAQRDPKCSDLKSSDLKSSLVSRVCDFVTSRVFGVVHERDPLPAALLTSSGASNTNKLVKAISADLHCPGLVMGIISLFDNFLLNNPNKPQRNSGMLNLELTPSDSSSDNNRRRRGTNTSGSDRTMGWRKFLTLCQSVGIVGFHAVTTRQLSEAFLCSARSTLRVGREDGSGGTAGLSIENAISRAGFIEALLRVSVALDISEYASPTSAPSTPLPPQRSSSPFLRSSAGHGNGGRAERERRERRTLLSMAPDALRARASGACKRPMRERLLPLFVAIQSRMSNDNGHSSPRMLRASRVGKVGDLTRKLERIICDSSRYEMVQPVHMAQVGN